MYLITTLKELSLFFFCHFLEKKQMGHIFPILSHKPNWNLHSILKSFLCFFFYFNNFFPVNLMNKNISIECFHLNNFWYWKKCFFYPYNNEKNFFPVRYSLNNKLFSPNVSITQVEKYPVACSNRIFAYFQKEKECM